MEEHGFDGRVSNVIPPLKTALLPPTPSASSILTPDSGRMEIVYLPPRQNCALYVKRFFSEVHCLHWFYSSEQFHNLLERTYQEHGVTASASWLCSLYSIFAMGSATPLEDEDIADFDPSESQDRRHSTGLISSSQYLAMAKSLVQRVCDEADLESIRALALLVGPALYISDWWLYVRAVFHCHLD